MLYNNENEETAAIHGTEMDLTNIILSQAYTLNDSVHEVQAQP